MLTELRHLRVVIAAAESGSFSAAAARLNVEVSAVSRSIRDLEDSVGVALFERFARGVRLTEAGRAYVASAREIVARFDRASSEARLAGAGVNGRLTVGFVWSFTSGPVVELIRTFGTANPSVALSTIEGGNDDLVSRLRSGDLDIAITATDPAPLPRLKNIDGLSSQNLWLEALLVAVPSSIVAEGVTWHDIGSHTCLCTSADDWRRFVTYVERLGGPTLRFIEQDVSREGLLGLVAAGLGWCIVPSSAARVAIDGVRIIPIVSNGAALQVEALWRPQADNPSFARFLALARQTFMHSGGPSQTPDPSP